MTEPEDHEALADDLDRETAKLAEQSARLKDEIGGVRDDWRQKRGDPGVPGAVPPDNDTDPRDQAAEQGANREAGVTEDENQADAASEDSPGPRSST